MASVSPLFTVIHWAHAQFRFEASKDRFQIGKHGIRAPKLIVVPVDLAGTQLINARMSGLAAFFGFKVPLQLDHIYSC